MTKVIYFAPYASPRGVGEGWVTFQILKHMCRRVDATVLTYATDVEALQAELPHAEVIGWQDPAPLKKLGRINWMLKPGYLKFLRQAKKWCQARMADGESWDLAHHLSPISVRFPSPTVIFKDCPVIIGPVGGGLSAPAAFRNKVSEPWYVRLRGFDGLRRRFDPTLSATYRNASLVLGVAPYVEHRLPPSFRGDFEVVSEWGFDGVHESVAATEQVGPIRFLAVTRFVPTKGVAELVEAFARVVPKVAATLDFVGAGPQEAEIRALVDRLKLTDVIHFQGRVAREEVDHFYEASDVFVLPSYREASGGVFLEAMTWGLPVVCVDYGGPSSNVPDEAGIKVPVTSREDVIDGLAQAMLTLAQSPRMREEFGAAGREHIRSNFLWTAKADRLEAIYAGLLGRETSPCSDQQIHAVPSLVAH